MKIYTYYENINFKNQDELVSLWETSWRTRGFEPIVLSAKDAKISDFYEEFVTQLNRFSQSIAKKTLDDYELSCWLRWLAYSTQAEEKFFVGDYDVINHNFDLAEPENNLHLMDDCCPCFASGRPSQFLNLCKKFINIMNEREEEFVELYAKTHFRSFHDQNFFILMYYDRNISKDIEIKLSRDRNFLSVPQNEAFWEKPLVHYSHSDCKKYCEKNNIIFDDIQRCRIIREHLNR